MCLDVSRYRGTGAFPGRANGHLGTVSSKTMGLERYNGSAGLRRPANPLLKAVFSTTRRRSRLDVWELPWGIKKK